MSRRKDSLPYILVNELPWWVTVILGAVVYALMKWVAPHCFQDDKIIGMIMRAASESAWMVYLIFVPLALLSAWRQFFVSWTARKHPAAPANGKPKRKRA